LLALPVIDFPVYLTQFAGETCERKPLVITKQYKDAMDGKSLNLTDERIEQLKQIFPEVFSEGKVDFNRLKDILGGNAIFPNEHYELSWAGKAEARKEIQKQTTNTLIPDAQERERERERVDEAQNIFIEGENLEVLRILQKSYFGKIKMIYIDPPYNTGNDSFVYPDDYAERVEDYNKRTGVTDEEGYLNKQDLWRRNSRENGQFHSVWLSMMYPRLYLARNLLDKDGVIFISIDDNEASNLKLLMDEVFGEENFVGTITRSTGTPTGGGNNILVNMIDYIVIYSKSNEAGLEGLDFTDDDAEIYDQDDESGRYLTRSLRRTGGGDRREDRPTMFYPIKGPDGIDVYPIGPTGYESRWICGKERYKTLERDGLIEWKQIEKEDRQQWWPYQKFYLEGRKKQPSNLWTEVEGNKKATRDMKALFGGKFFDSPKPVGLIKKCIEMGSNEDSLILDFFAGSGTTAHSILEMNEEVGGNRKFICVQMPEALEENSEAYKAGYRTIADISKARITKVIEKLQKARDEKLALESNPQILGFRSFKIAPSNFKSWRGDVEGEELLRQLEFFQQSEKDGSLHENMLVELLLKSGLPLTAKVETLQTSEVLKTSEVLNAYLVEDGKLFIFFGGYNKRIKELIHEKKPQRVVCLDSAFKGRDEDISNFKLELKEAGIELTII
jgi:adenine-specific DNA-methyltransferase